MNKLYVIRFDNQEYFIGCNRFDKQLRKAKIYVSLKMARKSANECLKHRFTYDNGIKDYKIIEVDIQEKGEITDV